MELFLKFKVKLHMEATPSFLLFPVPRFKTHVEKHKKCNQLDAQMILTVGKSSAES